MIVPLAIRRPDHDPSQPRHATTLRKHLGAAEVRRTLASARTAAGAFPRGLPARPEHRQGGA
jgi:hypothetical protein